MNDDERIDETIRSAASDYNRPPATPRDEMWNAIQAVRQNAGQVPQLHVTTGGVTRRSSSTGSGSRRFVPRFAWMSVAAAAVLLVATGVGIGRWTSRSASQTGSRNGAEMRAEAPAPVPTRPDDEIGSSEPRPAPNPPVSTEPQPARTRTPEEIRRNPKVVGTGTLRPLPGARVASNSPADQGLYAMPASQNNIYSVATVRHLADAEALLTSFSLGNRDARMDAQFGEWARGLLSNTRLLLDSPAGEDPRRAKLLQDLELVLAQIVQLSPNAAAQDRELIEGSIEQGHVMTRLRTAIPAGSQREFLEK